MIVLDTSALIAIILKEPTAEACTRALEAESERLISAGTLAEAFSVSTRHNIDSELKRLIDGLGCEIVSVTSASAQRVGEAYRIWGKGRHPAGLNFGDCFAYELAKERACRLLYVGDDFSRTDIERAF